MIDLVRIQLSRRKGFCLQKVSRAINGREVINVARGAGRKWGNPFRDGSQEFRRNQFIYALARLPPAMREPWAIEMINNLGQLRGKNLACWCKIGTPCHADVLLKLANQDVK